MSVTEQLRAVAKREYALVRTCLTTVDQRVLTPLEGRAAGLDSVLARVREVFGDLDDRLAESSAPQRTPSAAPTAAAEPVTAPEPEPEPTPEDRPADNGSAVLEPAEVEEVDEIAEEYLEAEEGHLTGELADNDDLRRVQAELRAKHTLQERDEQH